MAKSKPAALSPEEIEFLERRVWNFCRSPDEQNQNELYIHPNTSFDALKAGKVTEELLDECPARSIRLLNLSLVKAEQDGDDPNIHRNLTSANPLALKLRLMPV